jgi:hypothetical protein
MSKRRTHCPEFKAKVALEAISGRKTSPVGKKRVYVTGVQRPGIW